MTAVVSPFANNGYGSNPVISGASAVNTIPVATSSTAASWQVGLVKQAATPAAGFALVNATPTILTWTAPNDGLLHRFQVFAAENVTVGQTGGQVSVTYTLPDGTTSSVHALFGGGQTPGDNTPGQDFSITIKAGGTVTIAQTQAMSVGTAVVWAEIWGS
jgi:hypothetical protein